MMDITQEDVEKIADVKALVSTLLENADEYDELDGRNLYILQQQLDALQQACAVGVVATKDD